MLYAATLELVSKPLPTTSSMPLLVPCVATPEPIFVPLPIAFTMLLLEPFFELLAATSELVPVANAEPLVAVSVAPLELFFVPRLELVAEPATELEPVLEQQRLQLHLVATCCLWVVLEVEPRLLFQKHLLVFQVEVVEELEFLVVVEAVLDLPEALHQLEYQEVEEEAYLLVRLLQVEAVHSLEEVVHNLQQVDHHTLEVVHLQVGHHNLADHHSLVDLLASRRSRADLHSQVQAIHTLAILHSHRQVAEHHTLVGLLEADHRRLASLLEVGLVRWPFQ